MSKHYLNEVGTDILLDCGVDITDATVQQIWYKKPDGVTEGSWTGTQYGSYSEQTGLTGTYFVKYTTVSGDFDQSGVWKFQSYISTSAGTWWGEMVEENIYDQFE